MARKTKHGGRREGAGRPRKAEAFTVLLQLRVSPELFASVQTYAAEAGLSVAGYVRSVLDRRRFGR